MTNEKYYMRWTTFEKNFNYYNMFKQQRLYIKFNTLLENKYVLYINHYNDFFLIYKILSFYIFFYKAFYIKLNPLS